MHLLPRERRPGPDAHGQRRKTAKTHVARAGAGRRCWPRGAPGCMGPGFLGALQRPRRCKQEIKQHCPALRRDKCLSCMCRGRATTIFLCGVVRGPRRRVAGAGSEAFQLASLPGGWAASWGQTAPCIFKARPAGVTFPNRVHRAGCSGSHQSQPLGVLPQAWERGAAWSRFHPSPWDHQGPCL